MSNNPSTSPENTFPHPDSLYHQLFNLTNIIKLIIDPDTLQILEANPAACQFYGYSAAQMTSMQLSEINTRPESEIRATAKKIMVGTISIFQTQHRLASGQIRNVEIQAGLIDQVDKRYLYEVIQDVTERKRTEAALRRSERLHRLFAQNMPDSSVVMFDTDMRYTLVEGPFLKRSGMMSASMIGKLPQEILATHEAIDYTVAIYQRALKGESFSYERQTPDYAYEAHVSPLYDENGQIIGGMILSHDITKRKHLEDQLRTSEERLRSTLDYAPIGMALFTLDGYWLDVNPAICQILGYPSEELFQKTFKDLTHPDDLELDLQPIEDLLAGKIDLYRMEKRYFHKEGHVIWTLLSVSLVRDKAGEPLYFISQIQDITERKRLESMLLEKQKLQTSLEKEQELSQLKTRMMERIAHEFRTPLSVIQSTAETLIHYYDRLTPEKRETKGDVIKDQINHIISMLDEISQVVRNTDGGQLEPQRIDLGMMCREIGAELTTALNLSGKYIFETQGNLLATIDSSVIHDSLAHIMRNAALYSEPADPVRVRIDQIGDRIELRVIDHGIGIKTDELPRIFEAFFRGSNINERGGLGVGLTIARATIEAHGGTIRAESELNKGTTVIVTLPI